MHGENLGEKLEGQKQIMDVKVLEGCLDVPCKISMIGCTKFKAVSI
jgi:hypothetical protein